MSRKRYKIQILQEDEDKMNENNNKSYEWAIENAKSQIQYYQGIIEQAEDEIKKSEWMNGQDRIKIKVGLNKKISIQCNYESWRIIKGEHSRDDSPFFLEIQNRNYTKEGSSYIALSTEKAKQLRDYLCQKIEYLES